MATDLSKYSPAYKNIYTLLDRMRTQIIEEGNINYSRWKALGATTTGSGASRVAKVASAASADQATKDGNGNVIATTYVSKNDASSVFPTTDSNNTFTKTNTFEGTTNLNGATNINGALKITVPAPDGGVITDKVYGALRLHMPMTSGTYVQQYPIRYIGCDGVTGDTKQQTLVFGSYTGSTIISSGEGFSSGAQTEGTAKILGTGGQEDIYLASDSEIHMFTGLGTSNNSGAGVEALYIATTGDVSLAKTLTVTDATTINGATTLNSTLQGNNASGAETWKITRAGAVTGFTSVETSGTVKGVKTVDGAKTTTWQLTNAGALTGISSITTTGTVKGVKTVDGTTSNTWSITNAGNAVFPGTLSATGNATLGGTLKVTGATTLTGAATLSSTLGVAGKSTLAAVDVTGLLRGLSGSTAKWNITNAGAATFGGTLNVTGATTLAAVTASGAATLNSTLKVAGASTMAAITSSGTVKGSTDKWSITNAGAITAVSYNSTSDLRLKESIEPRDFSSRLLDSISPCAYNFKDDEQKTRRVGLIAQDLEKILPEAVREDANGYKSIDYSAVTAMLIGIIKEQDRKISALTDIVDILVAKVFEGEQEP